MPKDFGHIVLVMLGALCVFAIHMQGFKIVDPTYTGWLYVLNSDYSTHFMGWEYFRYLPWDYPLGRLEGYAYPMVSSIGYTDSIPLLALSFKMINPWLPESFQYFGIWLVLCYLLQGWFGYKLSRLLGGNKWISVVIGLFAVLSTPLLFRTPHPALCGQWLILASLYIYLFSQPMKSMLWSSIVAVFSAWVHPYLFLMCLAIGLSTHLKWLILRKIHWLSWVSWSALTILISFLSLHAIGYFIIQSNQATGLGLGEFSANINTFFNARDFSLILPGFNVASEGQYEGFAYLGLGLLILFLTALPNKDTWKKLVVKSNLPLLLAIGSLAILSVSPNISIGNVSLLNFKLDHPLFATFRSNGRFIWPLFYLTLMVTAWAWNQRKNRKIVYIALGVCLVIQFSDLWPLINRKILSHQTYSSPLSAAWEEVCGEVERIYLYPPFVPSYASSGDALHFLDLGRKTNTAITTGHLARRDDFIADSLFETLGNQLRSGTGFDTLAIYIMDINGLPILKNSLDRKQGLVRKLDDYLVFVPEVTLDHRPNLQSIIQQRPFEDLQGLDILRLEDFISRHDTLLHLISVKDEASHSFCKESRTFFQGLNSVLANIQFREAYIGLFEGSELQYEQMSSESIMYKDTLPERYGHQIVEIISAGANDDNLSSILVNGAEYSLNQRGFNVVSINTRGEVAHRVNFDTYTQCARVFKK